MPADCCKRFWNRIMGENPEVPVFTLVAYDKIAAETVEYWIKRCREEGVNEGKIQKGIDHFQAMLAYAEKYPERMKLPD